jgi:Mce-associated membrane protein
MTVDAPEMSKAVEPERGPGWVSGAVDRWRAILVVVLTVAAVALAGWVYYFQYRPDEQVDASVSAAAKKAAEEGTVAMLSYSPESLTADIAKAKSHLTGEVLDRYTRLTDQILPAAAQQREVATTASVVRAAVSELHADSAVVLVFVDKESTSKANPAPKLRPAAVRATMKMVNGSWLIEKFEPL